MTPTRAAIYVRVSTTEQDYKAQQAALEYECQRRGWAPVVFPEKVSGMDSDRPEYRRLVRAVEGGEIQHVLVWALDRWSRSEKFTQAIDAVLDIERRGVKFHSLKEPMLDTPEEGKPDIGRQLLLSILPVIATFESQRRRDRVRLAMEAIKKGTKATKSGRPPGRQAKVTEDQVREILRLRKLDPRPTWNEIAHRVTLKAGTCSAVWSLHERGLWKQRTLTKIPVENT